MSVHMLAQTSIMLPVIFTTLGITCCTPTSHQLCQCPFHPAILAQGLQATSIPQLLVNFSWTFNISNFKKYVTVNYRGMALRV